MGLQDRTGPNFFWRAQAALIRPAQCVAPSIRRVERRRPIAIAFPSRAVMALEPYAGPLVSPLLSQAWFSMPDIPSPLLLTYLPPQYIYHSLADEDF